METIHKFIKSNAKKITKVKDESVNLIVTSPPYPMIRMGDQIMLNKESEEIANDDDFYEMSSTLNKVGKEMFRVLKPGSLMAINMADATRSNKNGFKMYSNTSMVINSCVKNGFEQLPGIIGSKPTNSPNKFLGSGMYPVMAYVTLEHEEILIFRKGRNREFAPQQMVNRKESAFFGEERNIGFSDIWNVRGTRQKIGNLSRKRNGAYPIEIPYRLISMFSVRGDVVLDPFLGTGTTSIAAAALSRNSIGVDVMGDFVDISKNRLIDSKDLINSITKKRILSHKTFIKNHSSEKPFYKNENIGVDVKTKGETEIILDNIKELSISGKDVIAKYKSSK